MLISRVQDLKIYVFGDGSYGQLGRGDTQSHLSPVEVKFAASTKPPVSFIAAGTNHSAFISGGAVVPCGDGDC